MSRAALSMKAWAIYLGGVGLWLLLAPNVPLGAFGLPETHEVWIHMAGMFCLFVAALDWVAAGQESALVFRWATASRFSVPVFFAAFVAAGWAPPLLLLFAIVDLAGATWTLLAMRADRAASPGERR
jgi:hypothetical protein